MLLHRVGGATSGGIEIAQRLKSRVQVGKSKMVTATTALCDDRLHNPLTFAMIEPSHRRHVIVCMVRTYVHIMKCQK